ncbi:2'-5' RNA ligase family protein [Halodesulfurarchaeum formicicum]|uniref:Phosphoesterase n=1 Tax=Halodesulfurarchaeum formicicum TaxID=1873524 RepID=A0A1J1AFE5_9EURY|nr:2'-5' RNA ligase family protein [Halodesulfurarchaeum formicicum]APE96555.1 phosphoesterase [Halodesulfurarchaeum formicicum]
MYSVNVPVPPAVRDLARELRPALTSFERIRPARSRTLVLKRLPAANRREYLQDARRARAALDGAPAFEAEITGLDVFREPPTGTAPVAYLAVESPGLSQLHQRLVDEFGAIEGLEGQGTYTPHVTLARDGPATAADSLLEREIEPVRFTVDTLELYDSDHSERVESISLPA